MLRRLEFLDDKNNRLFMTIRPLENVGKTFERVHVLNAGERIVGVKGNTEHEWWGAKGFWKNIEFLVAK